jgi:hypothetical protein
MNLEFITFVKATKTLNEIIRGYSKGVSGINPNDP